MQLMKEGDTWELYIPSELGYGDRGAGGTIPGGAALVFTLELITVSECRHYSIVGIGMCHGSSWSSGGVLSREDQISLSVSLVSSRGLSSLFTLLSSLFTLLSSRFTLH